MKHIYRITEKLLPVARKSKILSETFFTSKKKAVDYLHSKFQSTPDIDVLKYEKGKLLRVNSYHPHGLYGSFSSGDVKRYELDEIPVN